MKASSAHPTLSGDPNRLSAYLSGDRPSWGEECVEISVFADSPESVQHVDLPDAQVHKHASPMKKRARYVKKDEDVPDWEVSASMPAPVGQDLVNRLLLPFPDAQEEEERTEGEGTDGVEGDEADVIVGNSEGDTPILLDGSQGNAEDLHNTVSSKQKMHGRDVGNVNGGADKSDEGGAEAEIVPMEVDGAANDVAEEDGVKMRPVGKDRNDNAQNNANGSTEEGAASNSAVTGSTGRENGSAYSKRQQVPEAESSLRGEGLEGMNYGATSTTASSGMGDGGEVESDGQSNHSNAQQEHSEGSSVGEGGGGGVHHDGRTYRSIVFHGVEFPIWVQLPAKRPRLAQMLHAAYESVSADKGREKERRPSVHCHICNKKGPDGEQQMVCFNFRAGKCRKVLCCQCLALHDPRQAENPRMEWTCLHCRGMCPSTAYCHYYVEKNKERYRAGKFREYTGE